MLKPSRWTWALLLAFAVIPASRAGAQSYCDSPDYTCYTTPAAHVTVSNGHTTALDFDGLLWGQLGDVLPRMATASVAGASGYAEATKKPFAVRAMTNASKDAFEPYRTAEAVASYVFIAHDSQNRLDVTLNLKLKMSASATAGAGGTYGVGVCGIGEPGYVTSNYIESPRCGTLVPYSYFAGAFNGLWSKTLSKFGQLYYNLTGSGYYVEDNLDTGVHVVPGLPYLITVFASSSTNPAVGGAALAAVDPVLEPAAVNPDVTIEFPNLADNPNPQPVLGDLTAADLAALGIDAQPFIDLGFFDTPTQDPPPSDPPPPAPAKAWCGPGFWLNNAAKFSASAWRVPTTDSYNATAGQRLGCPAAAGNPTLQQVLQNPKAYFGAQFQGMGFNCVADHLSGKSGLLGTAADNNAACTLDQFGQQVH